MRQGGKNRSRGRNGRNGHKPHMPMRVQNNFDSGGGEMRIRGNAWQVHERYLNMARDAAAAGDRIAAENFFQHADHYYRMINANGDGRPPYQQHGGPHPHQGQHPGQHPPGPNQQPMQHPQGMQPPPMSQPVQHPNQNPQQQNPQYQHPNQYPQHQPPQNPQHPQRQHAQDNNGNGQREDRLADRLPGQIPPVGE